MSSKNLYVTEWRLTGIKSNRSKAVCRKTISILDHQDIRLGHSAIILTISYADFSQSYIRSSLESFTNFWNNGSHI